MSKSVWIVVATSLVWSSWVAAAPQSDSCQRLIRGLGGRPSIAGSGAERFPLSQAAQRAGIQYFLMKIKPAMFAKILKTPTDGGSISIAATEGYLGSGATEIFDHRLIPLFSNDQGRWAHQLIRNGNDSIYQGVRSVNVNEWMVGLIFPVEILDLYSFRMGHTMTVDARLNGSAELELRRLGAQQFLTLLNQLRQLHPFPDSSDVHSFLHFSTGEHEAIPMGLADILWVPAPLMAKMVVEGMDFPGRNGHPKPDPDELFSVTIAKEYPGSQRGWRDVTPPTDNGLTWIDPYARVGTWFNVVPDWGLVRAAITASGGRKIDLPSALRPLNPEIGDGK